MDPVNTTTKTKTITAWMTQEDVAGLAAAFAEVKRLQPMVPWKAAYTEEGTTQFMLQLHGIDFRLSCHRVDLKEAFVGDSEEELRSTTMSHTEWQWWMVHEGNVMWGSSRPTCRECITEGFSAARKLLSDLTSRLQQQVEMMPEE